MYIVTSSQNTQLVGVPYALLLITENPNLALDRARQIRNEEDAKGFVSQVSILQMFLDKQKTLSDYYESTELKPIVFTSWKMSGNEKWYEEFFGDFRAFNRRRISVSDKSQEIATQGKFRAIVQIDSDEMFQIGEDANTAEEALELCNLLANANNGYLFQVFNDRGEPQIKDDKLIVSEFVS